VNCRPSKARRTRVAYRSLVMPRLLPDWAGITRMQQSRAALRRELRLQTSVCALLMAAMQCCA
jgi:hypothetical protein